MTTETNPDGYTYDDPDLPRHQLDANGSTNYSPM